MPEIKGLEIFATGTWNGDEYTVKDLEQIVTAFDEVGFQPPLKLGHTENQKFLQKDGLPAAGWVNRVYVQGNKLLADIVQIPKKIFELLTKGAYKHVSSEIYWNLTRNKQTFPRALKAVALLGAETPAVSGLTPIDSMLAQFVTMLAESAEETKAYIFETPENSFTEEKETDKNALEQEMGQHIDADKKKKKKNSKEDKNKINQRGEGEVKMTIEELQAQMEEMKATMKADLEAKSKAYVTELEALKTTLKEKDTEVAGMKKLMSDFKVENTVKDVKSFTAELVKSGKLAPARLSKVETLLTVLAETSSTVKTYKDEKEVEVSVLSFAKSVFSEADVVVEFKELSESATDTKEGGSMAQLDQKIAAYAEKHKVEYAEALGAVTQANPGLAKKYFDQ